MIRVKIPPERDRFALKGDEKTVRNAEQDVEDHDPANDPDVRAVDGDTKQEKADTDFEGCGCEGVEDFAEEPVLFGWERQYSLLALWMVRKDRRLTIKPV